MFNQLSLFCWLKQKHVTLDNTTGDENWNYVEKLKRKKLSHALPVILQSKCFQNDDKKGIVKDQELITRLVTEELGIF